MFLCVLLSNRGIFLLVLEHRFRLSKKLKFRLLKYVFVIHFSFKILYKYIIYYFESIIFKNLIKNIYYDLTYNFFYNLLSKIKIKCIIN